MFATLLLYNRVSRPTLCVLCILDTHTKREYDCQTYDMREIIYPHLPLRLFSSLRLVDSVCKPIELRGGGGGLVWCTAVRKCTLISIRPCRLSGFTWCVLFGTTRDRFVLGHMKFDRFSAEFYFRPLCCGGIIWYAVYGRWDSTMGVSASWALDVCVFSSHLRDGMAKLQSTYHMYSGMILVNVG